MNIAYYMPFKPLGHQNPSGDLVTGTEIYDHLNRCGHSCRLVSKLRCRWIYYRPLSLLKLLNEQRRVRSLNKEFQADLWLTYHSYYKAPDLLGPRSASRLGIPYTIFQGIYSTKRRKKIKTLPGFLLNRYALLSANLVFTNKKRDVRNLRRLLPEERICYIAPGLHTTDFTFSEQARKQLRHKWNIHDETVVMTAAMFRPGVKTKGIMEVVRSCSDLLTRNRNIRLVIVGDGAEKAAIHELAEKLLPERVVFCGKVKREQMATIYSVADIFAFPGIEESLGMVYLEAQACGLPVVAYEDWGGREAVLHGETGFLSPAATPGHFTQNLDRLVTDSLLRNHMGECATRHIRNNHELDNSYTILDRKLREILTHSYG